MQQSPRQIVLLGGGYVSVWAYRSLVKNLRSQLATGQIVITVVCPVEHHAFHGWTAECLMDVLQHQHGQSLLADVMPKARLLAGKADAVDTVAGNVSICMNDGLKQVIPYDHLLLGIGAFDSQDLPGIQEWGHQIKSPQAFRQTKAAIRQLVQTAAAENEAIAAQLLSFTIIGGGFTGVELATNLAEYLDVVKKGYPNLLAIKPTIRLINRSKGILSVLQPRYQRLVRYAEKTLDHYGIEVLNQTQVARITDEGVFLTDQTFIPSQIVLSTVGQRRLVLHGTEQMPRDEMQRLYTNANQQVAGLNNVWGGGDACHVKLYPTDDACPANALWAIKHGEYVGRNIARALKGQNLKPFTYKGLGQSASLGVGKGITELYGLPFTGWLAWIMRWFFFMYFMPSRSVMLRAAGDWFFLLFRQKRIGLWLEEKATSQPLVSRLKKVGIAPKPIL